MSIFAIFLLLIIVLLMLKIKLFIYFRFDNFESYIKVKGKFINFKRKGTLIKRKKKYIIEKKITKFIKNKDIDIKKIKPILKYIEVDKLNINVVSGAILLFPTIFSVSFFSTILEYIKILPFKKLKNYKYTVIPFYEELKFNLEIDMVIKVRILYLIKIVIKLLRKNARN